MLDLPEPGRRAPGLLSQWRGDGAGRWQGLVVYALDGDGEDATGESVVLVQAWVPAEHLEAARA